MSFDNFTIDSAPLVTNGIGLGSSRRKKLIDTLISIGKKIDGTVIDESNLYHAFNKLHSSACILDDMLDQEIMRTMRPAYHIKTDYGIASIASMHLMLDSIHDFSNLGVPFNIIIKRIKRMIYAEEADVGLITIDHSYTSLEWFRKITSTKLSHGLLLVFDAIVNKSNSCKSAEIDIIYEIIKSIGVILQITNDWRDFFVNDPFYRIGISDNYKFTHSLPLAVYSENEDSEITNIVGTNMSKREAQEYLNLILSKSNKQRCVEYIYSEKMHLDTLIQTHSYLDLKKLSDVIEEAISGEFWLRLDKYVA